MTRPSGPLVGLKVLEFAGIGPAPFCGMLLSDLGADVIRIDRKAGGPDYSRYDVTFRGRRSVALDLKNPLAAEACLTLIERADALIEGFRPGVMERLGLGPDMALARNPALVYGRMTGWGQTGVGRRRPATTSTTSPSPAPCTPSAPAERPVQPVNLVGDYGGGSLYLAFGLLAALRHAHATGEGQVIDCAMTDGALSLMAQVYGNLAAGTWRDEREANIVDGGSPFYNPYRCADGKWIAIAAIEPQFYGRLRDKAGLDDPAFDAQMDQARWPELKEKLAAVIATRTRDEWCAIFEGEDACVAPVLSLKEAPQHPYNVQRGAFVEVEGVPQPAPRRASP
ncbi:MAG: CaiB/BaiF CoA-transferase family protein [Caulobacteraceae bacterium]